MDVSKVPQVNSVVDTFRFPLIYVSNENKHYESLLLEQWKVTLLHVD